MKARLTRLAPGTQKTLISGDAAYPPRVGESFTISGPYNFDTNSYRRVKTSPVTDVMGDGKFRTVNGSLYKIEILARTWN